MVYVVMFRLNKWTGYPLPVGETTWYSNKTENSAGGRITTGRVSYGTVFRSHGEDHQARVITT
jgi:hypothetical protein